MLHKQITDMLNWKVLVTNDKEYKKNGRYYLLRKGLSIYAFGNYPTKENWKKDEWVYKADKKKVIMNPNMNNCWETKHMLENLAGGSWRINFRNHWIRFDELRKEDDSHWTQQCPDYYLYDSGNEKDAEIKKKKIPVFGSMVLAYDGNCLNLDSEEGIKVTKQLDEYLDLMRLRTNKMAKARRLDKRAVAAIEHAEETGNYLAVNPADAFKVKNVSTRRKYLSKYSVEEIVESMKYEVCDKANLNGSEYELIKFPIEDPTSRFPMCYYLKMINVSTDEVHLEGVGPYEDSGGIEEETVEAALMWRDQEQMHQNIRDGETVHHTYNAPIAIS